MSLSRHAKRGISILQRLTMNPKRALYHLSQKNLISLDAKPKGDPKLVTAATEAMEILRRNGEAANVNSEAVSEVENDAITPRTEGGAELSVPLQQQDSEKGPEGGPFGPFGGGQ